VDDTPDRAERTSTTPSLADGATILLGILVVATLTLIASWSGGGSESVLITGLKVAGRSGITTVAWLLAAIGWGAWCLRLTPRRLRSELGPLPRLLAAAGMGAPLLLWLASALGTAGLLDGTTGWALVVVGLIGLVMAVRTSNDREGIGLSDGWLPGLSWASAPALAVLLLASASAPGWLWRTEFGGYDALSYHLQLPREWVEAGRIFTPTWNVYGGLPNLVESGYFHLMQLEGTTIASAYSAQLLHAIMTVLTALTTAAAIGRWFDPGRIGAGFSLLLGTPWVIVVGSLAYDEMAAAWMLATALLLLAPPRAEGLVETRGDRLGLGLIAGILASGAVAMKLTAVGMVALPIAYLLIRRTGVRGLKEAAPVAAVAGMLLLAPWLVRNFEATGNPVFPFATSIFGNGHFTPDQIARFNAGHVSDAGLTGRIGLFFDQFIRFGIGPAPDPTEPWIPQWSLLPVLMLAGLGIGLGRGTTRRRALDILVLCAVPCLFWLLATHLKSRFLVPAIPSFVLAAMYLLPRGLDHPQGGVRAWRPLIGGLLLAWCCLPVWLFHGEKTLEDAPAAAIMVGRLDMATGTSIAQAARNQESREAMGELLMMGGSKSLLALVSSDERVIGLGTSDPFLYLGDLTYCTVWDRHPIADLLDAHPGDVDEVVRALHDEGFTLLLVNRAMLENWARQGWLDPSLGVERVAPLLERLPVEFAWPNGELLLRIPAPE